jgi:hypothetical protein
MPASNFIRELLPPPRACYERENGPLGPERRGWAQGRCPFHKSKSGRSFSVNLATGGFHCFGCDARGGDVIAFVMLRDHISFVEACKTLGCWRNVTADERTAITRRNQEREWNRQRETEQADAERRTRLQVRDELHTTVRLYQQLDGELHEIGPQAEEHWSALPYLLDDWRLTESSYCTVSRLENPYE